MVPKTGQEVKNETRQQNNKEPVLRADKRANKKVLHFKCEDCVGAMNIYIDHALNTIECGTSENTQSNTGDGRSE